MQFSLQVRWNREKVDDDRCGTEKLLEGFSFYWSPFPHAQNSTLCDAWVVSFLYHLIIGSGLKTASKLEVSNFPWISWGFKTNSFGIRLVFSHFFYISRKIIFLFLEFSLNRCDIGSELCIRIFFLFLLISTRRSRLLIRWVKFAALNFLVFYSLVSLFPAWDPLQESCDLWVFFSQLLQL